jgi:TnpA family transposase
VAFGLAYLFGVKLMPRIRNWKDLNLYRPRPSIKYKNVDTLFSTKTIRWQLIEKYWNDMMQVILSIKAGQISSSHLLQRLTNYAKKNKLLIAFQELGKVVRTMFLIEYVSNIELREEITATTNKVESYNNFSSWIRFNSENYIVFSNDPDAQEKAIKYNWLIANAIILQNIVDISNIVTTLISEEVCINIKDIKHLSPYITSGIKRFGDFTINIHSKFIPRDQSLDLKLKVS